MLNHRIKWYATPYLKMEYKQKGERTLLPGARYSDIKAIAIPSVTL